MSTLLLLLLFVLAWVVLILPKQRELRRHNALVASLEVGDEVMNGAGIYGTITGIEGDVVWLEIAPDIEIRCAKRAIASKVVETADDETDDDETDDDEAEDDEAEDDEADDGPEHEIDGDDPVSGDEGIDPVDRGTDVGDLIVHPVDDERPDGRP
jgi:preprotein translocase subunit YajC